MTRRVIDVRQPDRFVVGTVGMPGERAFYLQVRQGSAMTSVLLEKTQVATLADRLDHLLDEVRSTREAMAAMPERDGIAEIDSDPLDVPIEEEFRVGAMALGWDDSNNLVVIEAHAVHEQDFDVPEIADDASDGPDTLRIWISAAIARAFCQRARAVVAAGRPDCPFCSQPIDPAGHICPRANGYRRRA